MSNFSRIVSILLVLLISAITSVLFSLSQGAALGRLVEQYPVGGVEIHLSEVPGDRSSEILAKMSEVAEKNGAIVRADPEISDTDGSLIGMRVGLVANSQSLPKELDLEFLGTKILSASALASLLTAEPSKSIGLDSTSADVLSTVPELMFSPRLAVLQLSRLIETSGTINGTYRVLGINEAQVDDLMTSLEPITGLSAESMLTALRGQQSDGGIAQIMLQGFAIAATVLLLLVLVFEAVRAFTRFGVHTLLGRSRTSYALSLFRPVLLAAAAGAVLSISMTLFFAKGYELNTTLVVAASTTAMLGAAVVLTCVFLAMSVLLLTKPVNAIRGRHPKKILLAALVGFYLLSAAGFAATFVALDGPLQEARTLTNVNQAWAEVSDQRILYREAPGANQSSFTGQSSEHAQDVYDWYSSIADQPGVALVNSQHYGQEVLDRWSGVYDSVPEQPFWYVAASPSYLAAQGFILSSDLIARAENGERLYFLPNSMSHPSETALREWIIEDTLVDYEPSITTKYLSNPATSFEPYLPETPLFLWNTDPDLPQRSTDPVILVLTPENMVPFESESLNAVGLENSYVKLSSDAAERYVALDYLAKFNLDDNAPEYLPVEEFVAGLKKTIQDFMLLFGAVAGFLGIFSLIMVLTLVQLFSNMYREALAVKRMLGVSLARLFMPLLVLVLVSWTVAATAVVLLQSTSGIMACLVMLAAQVAVLGFLTRRYSRLQINSTLKEKD